MGRESKRMADYSISAGETLIWFVQMDFIFFV